jgi:hypothetical protein
MLRTNVFNTITGWTGIVTHGFDLSSVLLGLFIPAIKEMFTMVAGPLYIVWFILIGIRLIQVSQNTTTNEMKKDHAEVGKNEVMR